MFFVFADFGGAEMLLMACLCLCMNDSLFFVDADGVYHLKDNDLRDPVSYALRHDQQVRQVLRGLAEAHLATKGAAPLPKGILVNPDDGSYMGGPDDVFVILEDDKQRFLTPLANNFVAFSGLISGKDVKGNPDETALQFASQLLERGFIAEDLKTMFEELTSENNMHYINDIHYRDLDTMYENLGAKVGKEHSHQELLAAVELHSYLSATADIQWVCNVLSLLHPHSARVLIRYVRDEMEMGSGISTVHYSNQDLDQAVGELRQSLILNHAQPEVK